VGTYTRGACCVAPAAKELGPGRHAGRATRQVGRDEDLAWRGHLAGWKAWSCSILAAKRVSSVVQEEIQPGAQETAEFATAGQLEELYLRFGPGGLRLAYLLLGDHQAAEDCVQEAFARVIARLGHVRTGQAFDAYLRRTIVNLTKNTWRQRSTERAKAFAAPRPTESVAAADVDVVDRLTMFQVIQALPIRQRTAIVLRFYEDLPEDDIAVVMRCRPGTARSLISRGMAALRSELERYADA